MQLNDFDYELPSELIAKYPAEKRSLSKLMCLNPDGNITHRIFQSVPDLVRPGDLLVVNDTKVIRARLFGKKMSGGRIELLIERVLDDKRVLAQVRASKSPRENDHLVFEDDIKFKVLGRKQQFYELEFVGYGGNVIDVIEKIGHIPLPPYMRRSAEDIDKERYQTIYAKSKGSVAAPTAGFHFDDELMAALQEKVEMGYLTLHIGAGTFLPVRTDDIREHVMHSEYLVVSETLCEQVERTKAAGGRIVAVGTTSMRALETASQRGRIAPFKGDTSIFIYPGYEFKCVDALITNLHLPCSTLLMLICAFGGYEQVMNAYREAVAKDYRFYSYGDAMWLTRV